MYLFFIKIQPRLRLCLKPKAATLHERVPDGVHRGGSLLLQASPSRTSQDSFRFQSSKYKIYKNYLFFSLSISSERNNYGNLYECFVKLSDCTLSRKCVCVCICAWRSSCSCLLSFNLGSSIDSTQTGSCYNFLDTCYYAAWQLSAISRSLKSHDNPPCLQKRKEKKKAFV